MTFSRSRGKEGQSRAQALVARPGLEKGPSGCSPSPQPCALHPAAARGPWQTGEVEETRRGWEAEAGRAPRPPQREPVACAGLARAEGRVAVGTPVWGGHGSSAAGAAPCCRREALSFLRPVLVDETLDGSWSQTGGQTSAFSSGRPPPLWEQDGEGQGLPRLTPDWVSGRGGGGKESPQAGRRGRCWSPVGGAESRSP